MERNPHQSSSFRTAVRLLGHTTPFLLLNAAIYGAFFLLASIWLGMFGGLAVFFAPKVELLAVLFFIVGISGPFAVLALGRRYILYLVKGAHVAVLTKLLLNGELPDNQKQVAYGRDVVKENFRDVSILFVLDRIINRVVKRFTRQFVRVVDWLPLGGGATTLAQWAAKIVNRSLSYVDEAILSYAIARDEKNVWQSSRHGILLYAQSYKPVLVTAVKVWLIGKCFFLAIVILLGIPGVMLMMTFDAIWFQLVTIIGILLLASLILRAVYEPFAMAYTLVTYHHSIAGVSVNEEWDHRLQSISKEFRDLIQRAREFGSGKEAKKEMQTGVENYR